MNWNNWGRTVVRGFKSLSGWEDSYYGGYYKVLIDYPDITSPFDLDWKIDPEHIGALTGYSGSKLIKLFLLKLNEEGLSNHMTVGITSEKIEQWGQTYTRYTLCKDSVDITLEGLIGKEGELSNLFEFYKKVIQNTEFFYDQQEKQKKNPGGGSGGPDEKDDEEGKKPEGDKPEDKPEVSKDIINKFQEMIGEVQKREYKYWSSDGMVTGDLKKKSVFINMKVGKTCRYEEDEVFLSNQLLNMLDISFDPAKDIINSLRSGKLDSRKICEVPSGNFNVYNRIEENQVTRPFSVCLLGDESGSMGTQKVHFQQRVLKILYRTFIQLMPPEKIFVYGHSGQQEPEIRVYHDKYNLVFEETIEGMSRNYKGENYDGPVIESVYEKVRSFTDDNIIFISLSDGNPSGCGYGGTPAITDMKRIIEKCKRDGFVTIGIGIIYAGVKAIYNYNTMMTNLDKADIKKVSLLVNHVVKTEFQN